MFGTSIGMKGSNVVAIVLTLALLAVLALSFVDFGRATASDDGCRGGCHRHLAPSTPGLAPDPHDDRSRPTPAPPPRGAPLSS